MENELDNQIKKQEEKVNALVDSNSLNAREALKDYRELLIKRFKLQKKDHE